MKPSIEHALRRALSGPDRHDVAKAVGFVLVTRKYLDAVATLGEVGMHCHCAREGLGECGKGAH